MPNIITEAQIEKAVISLLTKEYGYRHVNCYTPDQEALPDNSGRANKSEVLFIDILKQKAKELNPHIPEAAIDLALEQVITKRYAMSPLQANHEVYNLIRDGIPVEYPNAKGKTEHDRIKVIDFNSTERNDFLSVTQLWIKGEIYYRRPDIILYINGIPLVFIELKNSNVQLRNAYDDNLTNYKAEIAQLFQYNAVCVLSNAIETKVGSLTSGWEHFFNWLRIDDEKEKIDRKKIEQKGTSLERVIKGLCPKDKLLDYVENFILYHKDAVKIIAQNHQFIGVNKTIESFKKRDKNKGQLGVFWHTQGSGKSFSMIFFVRKVFHKFTGNFSFVVVTDRDDLDGQIYRNFLNTDTVKKNEAAQPRNSREMRTFLSRNMRLVFTLIHKFRWDRGTDYPLLSDRSDIIVIVDEAHRTQYKALAENMRKGLPNAQYIAFTGTPLLGRERKTNKWFGKYVSEYNFSQSVDDGATVPLFYQKRVPEVQNQNETLSDEFYQILEDENLSPKQQEKLEKDYSKEIEIIKRDDRLDKIAQDIAYHFPRRGYLGKGMVISVDKFTSVKMYDKVQKYWKEEIKKLVGLKSHAKDEAEKHRYQKMIDYMRQVEMAVVISQENGEEEKFDALGLDIRHHREILNEVDENGHDVEFRFKDPEDKLQLVFICAMWLTGFDAPTVSTLYLDKPMKDHTLMQAIARANRVTSYAINDVIKQNGEVIDYFNVFRNMKKALADYALGSDDKKAEPPVQDKENLFKLLNDAVAESKSFCQKLDIDIDEVVKSKKVFNKIKLFKQYANKILEKEEIKKEFAVYENTITSLFEACKPEILNNAPDQSISAFQYLRGVIDGIIQQENIADAKKRITELLDQSVITKPGDKIVKDELVNFVITQKGKTWNLSKMNFDKLKEDFKAKEYKNIEIADLRSFIDHKLEMMLMENATRVDFAQKLQEIIDNYNSGGASTENYYNELVDFTENLKEEEERHIRMGLSEDELELFDTLKKDKMTQKEEKKVRLAAQALLHRLRAGRPRVLVVDWYKDAQTKERVKTAIEDILHKTLPDNYDRLIFKTKCDNVYNLVYEYATRGMKWVR